VRSVAVHQHAVLVQLAIGIAGDVRALVDDVDAVAGVGEFACHDAAGVTGADDEDAFIHGSGLENSRGSVSRRLCQSMTRTPLRS
jgi:hypothetical protein